MCLHIERNLHRKTADTSNLTARIAGYDMLVFKVMRPTYRQDVVTSPYQHKNYKLGVLTKSHKRLRKKNRPYGDRSVHAGLHALRTITGAKSFRAARFSGFNLRIFPAIIPKGTAFFYGADGDIVAEAMTIYPDLDTASVGRVMTAADKGKHVFA